MKKFLSIMLSITMLISLCSVSFADDIDAPVSKGIIKVGINAEYPPFEYYEEDGQLTGFDIDLMNYIGERIGYEIEYLNMEFDSLIPAVQSGTVYCAISTITQTKERRQAVDFSRPYLRANVTENTGETSEGHQEFYSIVFKNGIYDTWSQSLFSSEDIQKYELITYALDDLISDGTVDKLIEKYNLNEGIEESGYIYKYDTVKGSQTPVAKTDSDEAPKTSATSIPCSKWAVEEVEKARKLNIVNHGGNYNYPGGVTRETFCEMIYNLVVLINPDVEMFVSDSFTDTKNEKVLKLNSLGIINGKTETKFAPNDNLTREEAATIIMRMINKLMPMAATEMWFEYEDIDEISVWASDSVQTISNLGFMKGIGSNKFAPKDIFTTEQAAATLVRIYERAEISKNVDGSEAIGIIGGADGPTSVIIGDNINIIQNEEYDKFYEKVTKNKIDIDDYYINEAIGLIKETGEFANDKDFISLYTTSEKVTNNILSLGAIRFDKPQNVFYISADKDTIVETMKALAGEEAENVDFEKLLKINKMFNFAALASLVNGSYGADNLAAIAVLTNNRGYVMPKDFKDNFALFFEYEGEYSALVSFSEYGDGVISANMSFVKNGEKDSIFKRLLEITSVVGENSITIANAM